MLPPFGGGICIFGTMVQSGNWNVHDLEAFAGRGISVEEADRQLCLLKAGVSATRVEAPCTLGNGIRLLDTEQTEALKNKFESRASALRVEKFVPASGAASRMFRHLFEPEANQPKFTEFFERISEFPFYDQLKRTMAARGADLDLLLEGNHREAIRDHLLNPEGLSFGSIPKGAIPFHSYKEGARNAFEEHLVEMRSYDPTSSNMTVHFTVDLAAMNDHRMRIEALARELSINVSFSEQHPQTDTISLDEEGKVARDEQGKLIFRPGGHGALLHNLDARVADIIFIKNIDNVVPDHRKATTLDWKKVLGGLLLELTEARDRVLRSLASGGTASHADLEVLGKMFLPRHDQWTNERDLLFKQLDRPMRVAGMVKNEGEPGGGPFWVKSEEGVGMQIIEASQINLDDDEQSKLVAAATHFNPVDLACAIKRFDGSQYDLHQFVDHSQSFITQKSNRGRVLQVLEHPGLWNGGMAGWLSTFVQVPLETFAPVKTVNDLLREAHR